MKITILDGYTTNPGDISWAPIEACTQETLMVYESTTPEDLAARAAGAQILVSNALQFGREEFRELPDLKLLCLISTGYSHVDLAAARQAGVAVTNTPGYSTEAVAQHTIALLLELTNQVALHDRSVREGGYFDIPYDCYFVKPLTLLAGKTLGIIGYGNIGRKVGHIAAALGMEVIPYSRDPEGARRADVVSLHCPLTRETRHLINTEFIHGMKDGALLLNTARGSLVDEAALAHALETGKLAGAGLDVLVTEPQRRENPSPLLGAPNCVVTPHNAWMPRESRQRLIHMAAENIVSFLEGGRLNRVD